MKNFFLIPLIAAALSAGVLADHGPGTSGSGAFTESAETLKPRQWSASVRTDWTEFDVPSSRQLEGKDRIDLIERSFLTTMSLGLGITGDFQLSMSFGYYAAEGTRELEHESHEAGHGEPHGHTAEPGEAHERGGPPEAPAEGHQAHERARKQAFTTFDPDGWTDLWIAGKYRLYRGPAGQIALYGGIKAPVGETRVINSAGERVEPAASPGTGAWDEMLGLAYTQALAPSLALDASAQYTLRGKKFDYRLGDRVDAGVSLGWRVLGQAKTYPQVSLVGEASVRSVARSSAPGDHDLSTGGTVFFLSPGARLRFSDHAGLSVAIQLPVVQDLNGDQVETAFRLTGSLNFSF